MYVTGTPDIDFVRCAICGYSSKKLGNHLLKAHGLSTLHYQEQYPDSLVLCANTVSALSEAHHGRMNWVTQMKQNGKEAELQIKTAEMGKRISSAVLANQVELQRRSKLLGKLNKTDKFRKKASETAVQTSSRIDILLARSERLRQWREENPQAFYEKCTSRMVKMQSSKPEKTLAAWVRDTFPIHEFRSSQKLYNSEFTTTSKQRQIDIFSKKIGIAIEFDGRVHFVNIPSWNQLESVQARDAEVNRILSKEFLLIRVSYDQWHSKRGFTEPCLNQIKQEISQHLIAPTPRLVYIGWVYHQDAEHKTASKLTMRMLTNG